MTRLPPGNPTAAYGESALAHVLGVGDGVENSSPVVRFRCIFEDPVIIWGIDAVDEIEVWSHQVMVTDASVEGGAEGLAGHGDHRPDHIHSSPVEKFMTELDVGSFRPQRVREDTKHAYVLRPERYQDRLLHCS